MAIDTFSCPECQVKLRRSPHLQTGVRVQCPKCQFQCSVPPPEEEAPPRPPPPPPPPPAARVPDADAFGHPPEAGSPYRDRDRDRDRDREQDDLVGTEPV